MRALPPQTIDIPTADAFAVRGDLYLPAGRAPSGIVILCHGFKGYRNWGFFPYLAARLAAAGIGAYSIDFSFNGTVDRPVSGTVDGALPEHREIEDPAAERHHRQRGVSHANTRYVRPDLFRRNTLKREHEDLALAVRSVRENGLGRRVGTDSPVGLFGHSRGGVSAFLCALEDDHVAALCTWATPDHPDHFTPRQKARWRENGEFDFADAGDGTRLSLSSGFLDDLEMNHDAYDLLRRAAELNVPHLIVHGKADIIVRIDRAQSLHEAESGLRDRKIVILPAGHTFGAAESTGAALDERPRSLVEACDSTVDWFRRYLRKGD